MNENNKPIIMGILNVTPDSFSDGGKYSNIEQALKQVGKMINEGAKIIDIGGESTRPGADFIDADEEIKRVIPIIKAVKAKYDVLISIDTYKSQVAKAAIEAGADMVNDVWGNQYDQKMLDVVCQYQVPYIWMHNQKDKSYVNVVDDILIAFEKIYQELEQSNYDMNNLYLDPGVGFAKNPVDNLKVISEINKFKYRGVKTLLGTSRKSIYKHLLDIDNPVERDMATANTSFYATLNGVSIIRVHNVKINQEAVDLAWQIMGATDERN